MKIREGLVSNSSSSSYFFRVKDLKFDDFVDMMVSGYWFEAFNKRVLDQEIKNNLKKAIKDWQKRSKIYDKSGMSKFMDKMHKDHILSCKKDLAELDKCSTNKKLVEFVLKHRRIKTEISKDGIEFSYFTSMHNDFNEGMEDLLKEIIMYFCFDTSYKVEFRREDDDNEDVKKPTTKDIAMLKENFLKEMNKAGKINIVSTPQDGDSVKKLFDKTSIAKDVSNVFPDTFPCLDGSTSKPKKGDFIKFLKKGNKSK